MRNIFFETSFFHWRKKSQSIADFSKTFRQNFQNTILRDWEKSLSLAEKKQKSIFLRNYAKIFRLLAERFHQCFQSCVADLRKTKFWKPGFFNIFTACTKQVLGFWREIWHMFVRSAIFFQYCEREFFSDFRKNFGTPVKVPIWLSRKTWLIKELIWKFFISFSHFEYFFSECWRKIFGRVLKTAFYVFRGSF